MIDVNWYECIHDRFYTWCTWYTMQWCLVITVEEWWINWIMGKNMNGDTCLIHSWATTCNVTTVERAPARCVADRCWSPRQWLVTTMETKRWRMTIMTKLWQNYDWLWYIHDIIMGIMTIYLVWDGMISWIPMDFVWKLSQICSRSSKCDEKIREDEWVPNSCLYQSARDGLDLYNLMGKVEDTSQGWNWFAPGLICIVWYVCQQNPTDRRDETREICPATMLQSWPSRGHEEV